MSIPLYFLYKMLWERDGKGEGEQEREREQEQERFTLDTRKKNPLEHSQAVYQIAQQKWNWWFSSHDWA